MERRTSGRLVPLLTAAAILLVAWAAWSFTWSVISPGSDAPSDRPPAGITVVHQEQPSGCIAPPGTSPYVCWNANRPKTFQ